MTSKTPPSPKSSVRARAWLLPAVVAATLLAGVARAEEPAPTPQEVLVRERAGAVVSVKMTLNISFTMRGSLQENESNQTTTGVVVDARGLVMVPAELFSPNIPSRFRAMIDDLKVVPSGLRVVFPGDPKEYAAILGAKDSKLGLAFLLIKDLEGRSVSALDLGRQATPRLGDTLYGVSRLGQDFDHAPICSPARVVAAITRPRTCWALDDAGRFGAEPLYTVEGAVAGVVVQQEGVGEEADTQVCLLPLGIVESTIERSMQAAERALEDTLAAEAEAAAAADSPEAASGEGDAPADGEAPEDAGDGEGADGNG